MGEVNDESKRVAILPGGQEAQIALMWLARLRWLAVVGQVLATGVAQWVLKLDLPLAPIVTVVVVTLVSNVAIVVWSRRGVAPGWTVPAVLLLDTCSLTVLLYYTGGPDNPFSSLYLVHVAMSVVAVGPAWTWVQVVAAVGAYLLLMWNHRELEPAPPQWAGPAGKWAALVLVSLLIAYFIGRVTSALREREQELGALREQASRNEQLAALTTLAAGAAHELGTPLGTIAVVAKELELAAGKVKDDDSMAEDARLIRAEVDRCRRILDRMRIDIVEDLSQKTSAVRLDDLIERVRQDLAADEQARLQVRYEAGLDVFVAPSRAIQQAVVVMVRNAFDATPRDQQVTLGIHKRGGRVAFEVEDRGHGMDEETLRRAGEPFFTTKPPGKGMGLGLFLVRLVAEKFGGSFKLHSKPGEGTRSVLELPDAS